MEKRIMKGTEEWQMFTDFWKLCQKYWIVEDNDNYWDSLMLNINELADKYHSAFLRHIMLAFLDWKEEELREMKQNGKNR